MQTDCLFGMDSLKIKYGPNLNEYYIPDNYKIFDGDKNISECNLVMCNSGNLILRGFYKSTNDWKIVWKINERVTDDC